MIRRPRLAVVVLFSLVLFSCNDPARPRGKTGRPFSETLLCNCSPTHITKDDWRIEFKNGPLPDSAPVELTMSELLAWPAGPEPGPRTQRNAKETVLYRVARAYMQTAFLRKSDCDLHIEVSATPDKSAPRAIIETPGRAEYCTARMQLYSGLKQRGIQLTDLNKELPTPIPVEITGVAFRDQSHPVWFARGSDKVSTLWELHPAIVKILP